MYTSAYSVDQVKSTEHNSGIIVRQICIHDSLYCKSTTNMTKSVMHDSGM